LDEFGIATGAEREELEYQREVETSSLTGVALAIIFGHGLVLTVIFCPIFCRARDGSILNPPVDLSAQRLGFRTVIPVNSEHRVFLKL
jgi:hypothetical protein